MCIVVDHGPDSGWVYAKRNVFAVGLWVLYWVCALSAMLFARSRRHLCGTQLRLGAILCIGLLCNAVGYMIQGKSVVKAITKGDGLFNLIFQMFYVLLLMVINTFGHVCKLGAGLDFQGRVLSGCAWFAFYGVQWYFGIWTAVDAFRSALWWNLTMLLIWCVDNNVQARPARICMIFLATGVTFIVPNFLFNWDNDDPKFPFRAKAMHCLAAWILGYMWGYAQSALPLAGFMRLVDTYWPLYLTIVLVTAVPERVDLFGPKDPLLRLGVLVAWVFFAAVFARFTILSEDRPDYLGATTYMHYWTLFIYLSHQLQFGLFQSHPVLYYYTLWISFFVVMGAGIWRKSRQAPADLDFSELQTGSRTGLEMKHLERSDAHRASMSTRGGASSYSQISESGSPTSKEREMLDV